MLGEINCGCSSWLYINSLVLESCNSSALAMGIHFSCQGSTLSFLAGYPKSHFFGWYRNFVLYWYLKLDNQVVNTTCPEDKLGWIWRADDPYCRTLLALTYQYNYAELFICCSFLTLKQLLYEPSAYTSMFHGCDLDFLIVSYRSIRWFSARLQ